MIFKLNLTETEILASLTNFYLRLVTSKEIWTKFFDKKVDTGLRWQIEFKLDNLFST